MRLEPPLRHVILSHKVLPLAAPCVTKLRGEEAFPFHSFSLVKQLL